jgi:hypothetical protein
MYCVLKISGCYFTVLPLKIQQDFYGTPGFKLTRPVITDNAVLSQGSADNGFPFSKPPLNVGNGFFLLCQWGLLPNHMITFTNY